MSKLLSLLKSKLLWINVGLAVAITIVLAWIVLFFLRIYTDHGESVTVPDLVGLSMKEAEELCDDNNFQFVITDSVFSDEVDKGAVAEQNPVAGFKVKEGRTIYLIVNSTSDETVQMPTLEGVSLRQAHALLETYGLVAGNLKYVPDIAENVVIRQLYKGREIEPGTKIKKGSRIDLVLGIGLSDERATVPNLINMSYNQAYNKLLDEFLNVGAVVYDKSIRTKRDSAEARVYRQSPMPDTINTINLGSNVDIWLSRDTAAF
ncbi:MAG: PASTA domain-containing protein [Bacteroidales bacterium]|nr:PASTA domain-containing protein [Bacteroidales bacterium]HOY38464.1 PASTA domain-containing protein [Bacteroidales bacterium]HQN93571.1 PASTA domain-containing protein [Prolixibacteraceae bacterium]